MSFTLLALLLTAPQSSPPPASEAESPHLVTVWSSGEAGYHTFRIPSLVQAANGDLLALAEGRRGGSGDSGDIDLVLKRSKDRGTTWSELQVLWDDGENTCGNPCVVLDHEKGRLHLLATHNLGEDREPAIIAGTSTGTRTVWSLASDDHGVTWSAPRELTSDVKLPDWTWYATGPGAGIQLTRGERAGRLVIPCDHIEAESKRYYSHVIYSDDHGETWALGGSSPRDQVNECEVAELEDGRLLLNMRNYDRSQRTRQVALSRDAGATFEDQRHAAELPEPICQASLRRVSWRRADRPGVLAFSNPASGKARERMTLRYSFDDGLTWPAEQLLYAGSSAYSCLEPLSGGELACLFEVDGYARIVLARVAPPEGPPHEDSAARPPR
jgi:sialidase-1